MHNTYNNPNGQQSSSQWQTQIIEKARWNVKIKNNSNSNSNKPHHLNIR